MFNSKQASPFPGTRKSTMAMAGHCAASGSWCPRTITKDEAAILRSNDTGQCSRFVEPSTHQERKRRSIVQQCSPIRHKAPGAFVLGILFYGRPRGVTFVLVAVEAVASVTLCQ